MSGHTFRMKDILGPRDFLRPGDAVHLDQVTIQFRPNDDILSTEYQERDRAELTLRAETMNLMVRTDPGERFILYTEEALPLLINDNPFVDAPRSGDVGISQRSTSYSCALAVTPDIEGTEDYWCRTYRPIRDLPIIRDYVGNLSQFKIELIFPLLFADSRSAFQTIPDYRILKVYCEFSIRKQQGV